MNKRSFLLPALASRSDGTHTSPPSLVWRSSDPVFVLVYLSSPICVAVHPHPPNPPGVPFLSAPASCAVLLLLSPSPPRASPCVSL